MMARSYEIVDLSDDGAACVPLKKAQLCIDCEAITDGADGRCGVCGSQALLSIARVLDREAERNGEA